MQSAENKIFPLYCPVCIARSGQAVPGFALSALFWSLKVSERIILQRLVNSRLLALMACEQG
jgi:hypothetical protein